MNGSRGVTSSGTSSHTGYFTSLSAGRTGLKGYRRPRSLITPVISDDRGVTVLEVHGLRVRLTGDWPEVIENVRLDFVWFERPDDGATPADVTVEIECRPPDLERFGEVPASFITPRNVVYQRDGMTIVDYFGKAVSVLDRERTRLVVQGENEHLVYEAAYRYLVSRFGEHLERTGFVRLHALALVSGHGAVALMLPSGGGKSTMALRALRDGGDIRLLSEDSPLLDRRGHLHPFPLRIGINETDAARLPRGSVRRLERMEFHPKLLLDLEAFADRIEPDPQPLRHIVIGRRTLGRVAHLERVRRPAAVGTLVREAVVGVGIYQGMEFILQRGLGDVAGKLDVAFGRAACCAAGLARAHVWRATLGSDHERNWATLESLLH